MTGSRGPTGPLSYNATVVLQALARGHRYGFDVMKIADLPSGTVYPLLRRLEASGLVQSRWEDEAAAHREGRPARRYYQVTARGEAALARAKARIAAQQAKVFEEEWSGAAPGEPTPEAP